MDEAAKRVTGVLDEFQKKQDDFLLDLPIKAAGGAAVGLTFGILTKRFIKMRYSLLTGTTLGCGMALERYSQQLSAPYVQPPSCEINLARSRVFPDSLNLGAISNLLKGSSESAPPSEIAPVSEPIETEPVKEEPVSETAEPVLESAEPVIESAEGTDEPQKDESIVDAVIDEIKSDLNKAATEVEEVAVEVETAAQEVETVAETVETVAEKVEPIIPAAEEIVEVAQEVEEVAEVIEVAAEKTAEIAENVEKATE